MQGVPSIHHYRLATGRVFESRTMDIPDGCIEILEPMLSPGTHQVPNTPTWLVHTSIAGTTLIANIRSSDLPLLRMWVVLDGRDLRRIIPPPRILDLPLPVCIVEILHEQPFDPVVGWLRDLVATLAWAWVQHNNCPGSAPTVCGPHVGNPPGTSPLV
jgi:hypothetical protein